MSERKNVGAANGWAALFVIIAIIAGSVVVGIKGLDEYDFNLFKLIGGIVGVIFGLVFLGGLVVLNPNQGLVCSFAGNYKGEFNRNGFWWFNPFYSKEKLTLRSQNYEIKPLKVNDKSGNPIEIAAVIVWKVTDMYKNVFEVEQPKEFLSSQSEAALRRIAGMYEYDGTGNDGLSSSNDEIKQKLIDEINNHVANAGITITDANITHLAYAPEIASAMLQKQQAKAIIAARKTIVEGALGIVDDAIKGLEEKGISFDATQKTSLASNLLIVITGEKSPVTNVNLN